MPDSERIPLHIFTVPDLTPFSPSPKEQRLAHQWTRIQPCVVEDWPGAHTAAKED